MGFPQGCRFGIYPTGRIYRDAEGFPQGCRLGIYPVGRIYRDTVGFPQPSPENVDLKGNGSI